MRKSEMIVSMPMNSYDELIEYKNKYIELMKTLSGTLDTNKVDNNVQLIIEFDSDKALEICKKFLPEKYKGIPINKI